MADEEVKLLEAQKRMTAVNVMTHLIPAGVDSPKTDVIAPVFIEGDPMWRDVVSYSVYSTLYATELGLSKAHFDSNCKASPCECTMDTEDPRIQSFVDITPAGNTIQNWGTKWVLDKDFARYVICKVGNYDDIFKQLAEYGIEQASHGVRYSPRLLR